MLASDRCLELNRPRQDVVRLAELYVAKLFLIHDGGTGVRGRRAWRREP